MPLGKAIAQDIFKAMAGKGFSAARLISYAREAGGTYRRQDMLADIRKYEGRVKYQANIEKLGFDQTVPRAWMVDTPLDQPARYRVFGKATFYDEETDTYLQQTVSFYTDDLDTTGGYGSSFTDYFTGRYAEEDLEIAEFVQTGIEHNSGWSY